MRRLRLRQAVIKWLPSGIATAPFEFAFVGAYLLASGQFLLEEADGHSRQDPIIASLPFHGSTLFAFLAILFIGSGTAVLGLLIQGRHQLIGFQLERAGLFAFGAMIITYTAGIIDRIGLTVNISLITVMLELLAIAYRIALLGQVIDKQLQVAHDASSENEDTR